MLAGHPQIFFNMSYIFNDNYEVAKWLMSLPSGENFSMVEKAILNYRDQGMDENEIALLISKVFKNEISDYVKWLENSKLECL